MGAAKQLETNCVVQVYVSTSADGVTDVTQNVGLLDATQCADEEGLDFDVLTVAVEQIR